MVGKSRLKWPVDISELWNAVARDLTGSHNDFSPDQVIPRVIECLTNQHLIFIFTEVHRTCIGFIPEVIEHFWQPIVESVNLSDTYLVMFLVDNKGKVCKSGMPLASQVEQSEYPRVPLHLSPTTRFSRKHISQWLRMAVAAEVVPESLLVDTLLGEYQNGVPELVYQRICYYCGSRVCHQSNCLTEVDGYGMESLSSNNNQEGMI